MTTDSDDSLLFLLNSVVSTFLPSAVLDTIVTLITTAAVAAALALATAGKLGDGYRFANSSAKTLGSWRSFVCGLNSRNFL
mmetsp:Transcript_38380/g.60797  ORF Transcript_38380/g.60797 Transcript_38380/m.60797 type:complete len:81 (-) Transcript_38380:80-322(-)